MGRHEASAYGAGDLNDQRTRLSKAKDWALSRGGLLTKLVLVHDLSQAGPWLVATALGASVAAFGLVEDQSLLFAFAVGAIWASLFVLGISLGVWYFEKKRQGWRQTAEERETDHGERELERMVVDRMALALRLIGDICLNRLEISAPERRQAETAAWLNTRLWPALQQLSPTIGLGLLRWRDGHYSLGYDGAVPEIVRSMLPKRTRREFSRCFTGLKLDFHQVPLDRSIDLPERSWLVAFPTEELDIAAETVFAVGSGIVADAWGAAA